MRITKDNIKEIIPEKEQELLTSLLSDMDDINEFTDKKMYLDWQDFHNECSPEWTDPCPDYYGCYTIRYEDAPYEIVGEEMDIDELDSALLIIYDIFSVRDFIEKRKNTDD